MIHDDFLLKTKRRRKNLGHNMPFGPHHRLPKELARANEIVKPADVDETLDGLARL